jgi:tetratricopeptide (TPR) repeat protein
VDSSRPEELDKIYNQLNATNTSTAFKQELAFYYNYEKGRYYLIKGQYDQAYNYVKKSFEIKPGNADAQANMIANLSNFLLIDDSSTTTLAKMDSLAQKYSGLLENNNFIRVYGICQLKCAEEYFKIKNPDAGNDALADFEKLIENHSKVRFEDDLIGRAYSEAAIFYFKKGQNRKSIDYLNRGRKLAPSSTELKSRLIMIQ